MYILHYFMQPLALNIVLSELICKDIFTVFIFSTFVTKTQLCFYAKSP